MHCEEKPKRRREMSRKRPTRSEAKDDNDKMPKSSLIKGPISSCVQTFSFQPNSGEAASHAPPQKIE